MSWGEWMIVKWTLEEELQIEAQSRSALTHANDDDVRHLCASLIKQSAYQTKLMQQAVGHIAKIEMEQFLTSSHHQPQSPQRPLTALAYRAARYAKFLRNLSLGLLTTAKSVVSRYNVLIRII